MLVKGRSERRTGDIGGLTHLDQHGRARMVDVSDKPLTRRVAVARCVVVATVDALASLRQLRDGVDPLEAARVAGIQGAKQTPSLIPLCHPIRIDRVSVELRLTTDRVEITAVTEIVERTGVEMEALTACALAGLSLVESLLDIDPNVSVEDLAVWRKSGGRSGDWQSSADAQRHKETGSATRTHGLKPPNLTS